MSTMTLEQVRYEISALNAGGSYVPHGSLSKWADAIDAHLARQSEGVSDEDVATAARIAFGDPSDLDFDSMRAALTAVLHNRPAQEKTEPVGSSIATDDDVERVAKAAGWDNRRYMTPADYAIWCARMREFVRFAAPPAERVGVPDGWRVMRCTGSFPGDSDCWEIYDPSGSGGVITPSDVPEATVRGLLDALSAAPEASSHG